MIRRGDNPEGNWECNKYLAKDGDGYRGTLIAVSPDGTQAILAPDAAPTTLLLVRELGGPNEYPTEIGPVAVVPPDWTN